MSPAEEVSNEMLHYRLVSLEKTVEKQEADLRRFMEQVDSGWKSFSERVDKRFAELINRMGELAYVPRGEHAIAHEALEQRLMAAVATAIARAETAVEKAGTSDRHAWWAISMVATLVMGAIVTATLAKAF